MTDKYTEQEKLWLLERLKSRVVDEGACRLWLSSDKQAPYAFLPAAVSSTGKRRYVPVRRFVLTEVLGKPTPDDTLKPYVTCGNPQCVSKHHVTWMNFSEITKMAAQRTGYPSSATRNLKISKAKRVVRRLTDELALSALASTESISVVAKELGVPRGVIQALRSGKTYKQRTSMWAGLMR